MKKIFFYFFVFWFFILFGCSHTIHERKKDEKDINDHGSKTEFQIRGPKAAIKHSF